jgi:hypothetical protein
MSTLRKSAEITLSRPGTTKKAPYLWTNAAIDFMNQLIRAYPGISNKQIADRLTAKFGKEYSKNAVTGRTWRDRRRSR